MNNHTARFFASWIPIAAAGTVIFLTAYGAIQQSYRQSANDPQIEFARNAAALLSKGYAPQTIAGALAKTDMSKSLSIFGMSFDDSGKLVATNAYREGAQAFTPPAGVFAYVRAHGEDRVTWQTPDGLRYAAVVERWADPASAATSTASGFFLAARSLALTESREGQLGLITLAGWLAFLVVAGLAILLSLRIEGSRP